MHSKLYKNCAFWSRIQLENEVIKGEPELTDPQN